MSGRAYPQAAPATGGSPVTGPQPWRSRTSAMPGRAARGSGLEDDPAGDAAGGLHGRQRPPGRSGPAAGALPGDLGGDMGPGIIRARELARVAWPPGAVPDERGEAGGEEHGHHERGERDSAGHGEPD